jgi:shikimate kinase
MIREEDEDMTAEQAKTATLCGDCEAYFGIGEADDDEVSPAWDACYTCGKVAPLDTHGECIACELPEQFGEVK